MGHANLSDDAWEKILICLKALNGIYISSEDDHRKFVEAVLWVLRSDAKRRLLPPERGQLE